MTHKTSTSSNLHCFTVLSTLYQKIMTLTNEFLCRRTSTWLTTLRLLMLGKILLVSAVFRSNTSWMASWMNSAAFCLIASWAWFNSCWPAPLKKPYKNWTGSMTWIFSLSRPRLTVSWSIFDTCKEKKGRKRKIYDLRKIFKVKGFQKKNENFSVKFVKKNF